MARLSENTQLFSNVVTYYSLYFHSRNRVTLRLPHYFFMTHHPSLMQLEIQCISCGCSTEHVHWIFAAIVYQSLFFDYTPLKVKKRKTLTMLIWNVIERICWNYRSECTRKVTVLWYNYIIDIIDYIFHREIWNTHTYTFSYTFFLEYTHIKWHFAKYIHFNVYTIKSDCIHFIEMWKYLHS